MTKIGFSKARFINERTFFQYIPKWYVPLHRMGFPAVDIFSSVRCKDPPLSLSLSSSRLLSFVITTQSGEGRMWDS